MVNIRKDDLIRLPVQPRLRRPDTDRELFELLSLCGSVNELDTLVSRIDFSGAGPADICRIVHGRAPALTDLRKQKLYEPKQHFLGALFSDEFRQTLLQRFLTAFADKRRLVFLHVPKCAGTDLSLNLATRNLSLPTAVDTYGTNEEVLNYCIRLSREILYSEDLFVY